METKKQSEGTKPIDNFGTAPSVSPSIKQTNYSGTLLKERYLIEGELGRGGIGVVYLARDTQLMQRRVVIKVLLESSENSLHTPWFRKKFDQEVEALVRIDHPGVVGVLDVGAMPDGKPFFVMQFVEGKTLRALMQKEPQPAQFDLARTAHIVRQIGLALTAAHDKGIIHRDLKPENVMVQVPPDGEEVIKLIDFGIATVKDSQSNSTDTGKTKVAGALPYMAPEQLRGEPQAASDTWSLGVMAYELLTGQLPFSAETLIQLHEQQKQGLFPPPNRLRTGLPTTAEQVILKAMAYAAEARYTRARDFGDALSEALLNSIPRTMQTNAPMSWQTAPSAPTQLAGSEAEVKALTDTMEAPLRRPAPGRSPLPYFALAVLLLAIVAGVISYQKLKPQGGPSAPAPAVPERLLNYSLSVRLAADKNKPGSKPTIFASEIVFTPGDELQFNFSSPQAGYLYLINEAPQPDQKTGLPLYNVLFPDPAQVAAGAPSLQAAQPLIFPPGNAGFIVDKEAGRETIWVIWSERSLSEFEAFRKWLDFAQRKVVITDPNEIKTVQEFFQRHYPAAKPVVEKDDLQTHLKGGQDGLLVYPLRVEHR